jgi:molybdate transport system substrate-binding protein
MKQLMKVFFAVAMAALVSASGACAGEKITVFAAASLTNALQDIDSSFDKKTGNATRESFASSSTLARQIEAGAPAQIFISADTKWMSYLAQKGLVAAQKIVLGNELALIAPVASPLAPRAIDSAMDWLRLLGTDGRLALGDPDHVPAGIYAKEALQHLGAWNSLQPRLALAEDVRGALALVERGEAPLGIVYVTDARVSDKVKVVGIFPAASHSPIVYPAAIVKGADSAGVQAYFRFLSSLQAREVFARYGFAVR